MMNFDMAQRFLPLAEAPKKETYHPDNLLDIFISATSSTLNIVGDAIREFGNFKLNTTAGIRVEDFVSLFSPIFVAFGYMFVILFWGLHIVENATTMDLFTARGGVKAFIRLFLGKAFVDLAVPICYGILKITTSITSQIVIQAQDIVDIMPPNMGNEFKKLLDEKMGVSFLDGGGIPIIGTIIKGLNSLIVGLIGLLFLIPLILILIAVIFMLIGAMIKLTLKMAEFAILITISPSFFACLASDVTKEYFRRFITTFISIALDVVYMALVFAMMKFVSVQGAHLDEDMLFTSEFATFFGAYMLQFTFILAMGFMLVKPPGFLKNIVS